MRQCFQEKLVYMLALRTRVLRCLAVARRSCQNGMPLLIRDVFHERKNPIMKKGPHCGRGSAECFGILVRKKNTLLDVHGVQVMRESIPKEAALESSGVAGFHGRWNHWNVSGVHEPSFRAEGP